MNFDGFQVVKSSRKNKIYIQHTQPKLISYTNGSNYNHYEMLIKLCKDGIELKQSNKIKMAYNILNQYNHNFFIKFTKKDAKQLNSRYFKTYDNIFCLFFHYEFSHGNLEKCEKFISLMDSKSMSYERHYLKYRVLNWWINQRCSLNRKSDTIYNEIMSDINKMLDKKLSIIENEANAYQIIRDLIFYFKIGLYNTPFDIMKHRLINRFRMFDIYNSIDFEIKLLQRIDYIEREMIEETNGMLYVGIVFDDINTNIDCVHMNKNVIRFNVF
jgi:hypothetical protein